MKAVQLALMTKIESSLKASQQALLSRDVVRLEELTAEQGVLGTLLLSSLSSVAPEPIQLGEPERFTGNSGAAELHAAAQRVLHLGRVQRTILERAQRSLRLLSHVLRGTQASYAPQSGDGQIRLHASGSCSEEV